ncbi:hypothetical protein [Kribbella sp.]|uniref:sunset domain-containing protein n=1 Tax=Kribbella sp. TaxID=1871183 RepID=UPI0039C97967
MGWLLRHNWAWALLAFAVGAVITWLLLTRRERTDAKTAPPWEQEEPVKEEALVGAGATRTATPPPARTPAPPPPKPEPELVKPEPQLFSRRMEVAESPAPTLFDDPPLEETTPAPASAVPVGRYGEGSADAVPHQGPPDGFTIKGNAQSMLFHTPDSPYYGRTKPEVWFRSEADAERAGFSKYLRKPRKSSPPRP